MFSKQFIAATREYAEVDRSVPSPYLRRTIVLEKSVKRVTLTLCALGFYRFFLNGEELTRGYLSPYISNPDDILDYDSYDLTEKVQIGKNLFAFQLGNGMQNAFGGYVWDFDKAAFRSAPKMAGALEIEYADGTTTIIEADEHFLTAPSPLLSDDLRMGEIYDANAEIPDWNTLDFDDSRWSPAYFAETPKGDAVLCTARPIVKNGELSPISVTRGEWHPSVSGEHHTGYIYDFGENNAGIVRLRIAGEKGQKIMLVFGEVLDNGNLSTENITFPQKENNRGFDYVQKLIYICKGGEEEYLPSFTYFGFRYVFVEGLTEAQATKSLLTYLTMSTALTERGNFICSDTTLNRLQEMTRRATVSNFYHFPNDCPHREKNGWTADAALSAEHTLLNLDPEQNYYEWMRHIRKAQDARGALPGIVPTSGWGFRWGNGPAWDQVLIEIPYMTYRYTGNKQIVEESLDSILRYLRYLESRRDEKGLLAIGLGDWCAPMPTGIQSPLVFTDSVITKSLCDKAKFLCRVCDREADAAYCDRLSAELRAAIRTHLLDKENAVFAGNCQTSQAMGLYYGIFEEEEKEKAVSALLHYIEETDFHMQVGVLGARVMFHVLAEHGRIDTAYRMITAKGRPSYADWIEKDYTCLAESFPAKSDFVGSKNHHFWGDISAFFIKDIAGIHYNPNGDDPHFVMIKPHFPSALTYAKAYHHSPFGKIEAEWKRENCKVKLTLRIPNGIKYAVLLSQSDQEKTEVAYEL